MNDDFCPICNQYMDTIVCGYERKPFVDGKKYEYICHRCASVPKMYEYDETNEELIVFDEMDPKRMHSVEELMSDGWDRNESKISVKSVKASIKKNLKKV